MNDLRFGYAHYYQTFFGSDISQDPANYNFNGQTYEMPTGLGGSANPSYNGFPGLTFRPARHRQCHRGWLAQDHRTGRRSGIRRTTYSILHGKHAFKFGGEIIYDQSTENETSNAKGPMRFSSSNSGATPLVGSISSKGNLNRARLLIGDPLRYFMRQGICRFSFRTTGA